MWRILLVVLLVGCATKPKDLPQQPVAPTSPGAVESVGKDIDKVDNRVSAAVAVASENAEKPAVVKAELSVASAHLPPPSEGDLAIARQRASKADQRDYAAAQAHGKKLQAQLEANWAKMEADQKEAKRVSEMKDAKIKELQGEVERVKKDAASQIWTMAGAGLAIIGALACAFASIRIGLPIVLAGAFCGSIPFIIDSPYFMYIAGATLLACSGLGVWWLWDKVRDSVNER
jgi:hypothetical protein